MGCFAICCLKKTSCLTCYYTCELSQYSSDSLITGKWRPNNLLKSFFWTQEMEN